MADGDRVLERWFATAGMPFVLLRPDHYVYAVFDPYEAPTVLRELGRCLRRA